MTAGLRCHLLQKALLEAACGASALQPSLPFSLSTVSSLGSSALLRMAGLGDKDCPHHLFSQFPAGSQPSPGDDHRMS